MTFKDFHPNVKLRVCMSFLTNVLGNMVTPFMAVYFASTLGTTAAGISGILSIAVGLTFATLGGHYADRIGRRKMMVLAEGVGAASYLVMALANSPWFHSPIATLFMTMAVSAGWGLGKPAFEAMLIDVSTPEMRKYMYRITYWSNNLAISLAGLIGAYLFRDYLFELFLAVAVMSFISYLVTVLFIQETMPALLTGGEANGTARKQRKSSLLNSYRPVFRDKKFLIYLIASVLTVSVEMNLQNYIGIRLSGEMTGARWLPWLEARVDGIQMLGYLRTENTLGVVLLSFLTARLLKEKSDLRTMMAAMAVNIAGYSYLVFGNQPALLLLFMLAATLGELIYVPIKQSLLVNIVPDHARSSYMAINGMTNRIGLMLTGLYVIAGGFLNAWEMAALIFATGMAGLFLLFSIAPSLERRQERASSVGA